MSLKSSSAHTDEEKANIFNQFFFFLFTLRTLTRSPLKLPTCCPLCTSSTSMSKYIFSILGSLDTTKTMGIDGISRLVLKTCADALCDPIHHLFTVSLSNGLIPSEWHTHLITPIFKSGDKSLIINYVCSSVRTYLKFWNGSFSPMCTTWLPILFLSHNSAL